MGWGLGAFAAAISCWRRMPTAVSSAGPIAATRATEEDLARIEQLLVEHDRGLDRVGQPHDLGPAPREVAEVFEIHQVEELAIRVDDEALDAAAGLIPERVEPRHDRVFAVLRQLPRVAIGVSRERQRRDEDQRKA